jgi:hypothetical protein
MCQEKVKCDCPTGRKMDPKTCSPAQIKKCHPKSKGHPCLKGA